MRHAGAIDFTATSEQQDGADIGMERLAELADSLVEHAGAVRDHYQQLERTLSEEPPEPADTLGGARPVAAARNGDAEAAGAPHVHDSARLVVMEMAMSGSTREETKAYLREALDVEGGDPIVDEVFDRTDAAQELPLRRRLFVRRRN